MSQFYLPGFATESIVNVASVKKLSPFRYPGGKTWLVPRIRQWLTRLPSQPAEFIEPFAGGAIVGLTVAYEGLANHVTLVELDKQVGSVWDTIINRNEGQWIAEQIIQFDLTIENVNKLLNTPSLATREQAFQTIVKNRINRGGILAQGAGKLKDGENGKGIKSRWYPATLQKRILDISAIHDRLTFVLGDGLDVIRRNMSRKDIVYFIDPPYTAAGKKPGSRLYTHWEIDHHLLFHLASQLKGDFLMTYDNVEEVQQLAHEHQFETRAVPMKNTHHAQLTELLIGRNLSWLD